VPFYAAVFGWEMEAEGENSWTRVAARPEDVKLASTDCGTTIRVHRDAPDFRELHVDEYHHLAEQRQTSGSLPQRARIVDLRRSCLQNGGACLQNGGAVLVPTGLDREARRLCGRSDELEPVDLDLLEVTRTRPPGWHPRELERASESHPGTRRGSPERLRPNLAARRRQHQGR